MIERYSLPEMAELFTTEARLARWLEVEVLAVEGWAEAGVAPEDAARALRRSAGGLVAAAAGRGVPRVAPEVAAAVAERELVTDHDVAAFVDVVQEAIGGGDARWVHYGLTSSDVVDTALSATLVDAAGLLVDAADDLVRVLSRRAREHAGTAMVGRTHGMHAEPTTFGSKLALWALQVDRDRARLGRAREAVRVGKLSGAVGTYSNIEPSVEEHVCRSLGLAAVPATQVVARDRHAEYLYACASVGATVELIATEVRHLQRSEVAEVAERFSTGQKGSSAMPHKRNPIVSERLVGLSRLLRGYLVAGLEDVALWHERDISHSSVERVVLPDASLLAYYVLRRATALVEGLDVDTDRMAANLSAAGGLVFSQSVLLALVASGMERHVAYQIVQAAALEAGASGFKKAVQADARVKLSAEELERAFSLERMLRNAGRSVAALDRIVGGSSGGGRMAGG